MKYTIHRVGMPGKSEWISFFNDMDECISRHLQNGRKMVLDVHAALNNEGFHASTLRCYDLQIGWIWENAVEYAISSGFRDLLDHFRALHANMEYVKLTPGNIQRINMLLRELNARLKDVLANLREAAWAVRTWLHAVRIKRVAQWDGDNCLSGLPILLDLSKITSPPARNVQNAYSEASLPAFLRKSGEKADLLNYDVEVENEDGMLTELPWLFLEEADRSSIPDMMLCSDTSDNPVSISSLFSYQWMSSEGSPSQWPSAAASDVVD